MFEGKTPEGNHGMEASDEKKRHGKDLSRKKKAKNQKKRRREKKKALSEICLKNKLPRGSELR